MGPDGCGAWPAHIRNEGEAFILIEGIKDFRLTLLLRSIN
jgi:hypothetical protein